MTMTPSKNIGIGTYPSCVLDVNGLTKIFNGGASSNAVFILENPANCNTNYGTQILFRNNGGATNMGSIHCLRTNSVANYDAYMSFYLSVNGALNERMRINSNGNVGIGTTSPSYTLDVNGTLNANSISCSGNVVVTGNVTASTFNSTSDYRIKENVVPLKETSYTVDKLQPVHYFNKQTNKEDIGLIAHEVQEEYPFLVEGIKDGEINQSVNYLGLIGVLIKEIQELKEKVKYLYR